MSPSDYSSRLAARVAAYKSKWPARYSEHERIVLAGLAVPLRHVRDGLPAFAQLVVDGLIAERIRVERGWPDERTFLLTNV